MVLSPNSKEKLIQKWGFCLSHPSNLSGLALCLVQKRSRNLSDIWVDREEIHSRLSQCYIKCIIITIPKWEYVREPMKPQGGKAKNIHWQGDCPTSNNSTLGRSRNTGLEPKQYTPDSSVDFRRFLSPLQTSVSPCQLLPVTSLDTQRDTTRWWHGRCHGGKVLCIPQGPVLFF